MIGIYKITNKINGKAYIGQSSNIENRIQQHFFYYKHSNSVLHSAIKKYGGQNFNWEILEECSVDELDEKEKYWIKYYNTHQQGYNCTAGGQKLSNRNPNQILQLDPITLNIVNKYSCQSEILDILKCSRQSLSRALNQQKILKSYYWCYDNDIDIYKIPKKRIQQYDIDSGKLLNEYMSYPEALKAINVKDISSNRSIFSKMATGRRKSKIAFGYLWDIN